MKTAHEDYDPDAGMHPIPVSEAMSTSRNTRCSEYADISLRGSGEGFLGQFPHRFPVAVRPGCWGPAPRRAQSFGQVPVAHEPAPDIRAGVSSVACIDALT